MSFAAFVRSKYFFIHLGLVLLVIALMLYGTLRFLSSYTNHGEYVVVPDLTGHRVSELPQLLGNSDVSYEIIDSIYDPREKPGMVLRQDPIPSSKVKHNRTVYLYVTGMVPPQIAMPKLIDRSERQARLIIQTYGLKVGNVTEEKADCDGCVVGQLVKGAAIEPGSPVKKGSAIDLVVGRKDNFFDADTIR